jgi:hypothetical protein
VSKSLENGIVAYHPLREQSAEQAALSIRRLPRRDLRDLVRFLSAHQTNHGEIILGLVICESARRFLRTKPKF